MADDYTLDKVWRWQNDTGGCWASINRPNSGSIKEEKLKIGQHPIQLYSLGTPNGQKVTIMLEELLEAGIDQAEYDAYYINIMEGDQFTSGFVDVNPNSKIPALVDYSNEEPVKVFESGSILLYLAEKFNKFIPKGHMERTKALNWLFWQMGSAPYVGGGFGHFYNYAPEKIKYCIDRFTMETKRQLDVLDKHLSVNKYMSGCEYTISDIAIWPWYGGLVLNRLYNAAEFLDTKLYKNVLTWANAIDSRPAVKRGRVVNKQSEDDSTLKERHSKGDFEKITF